MITNLTPHSVMLCGIEVPPSGTIARVEMVETKVSAIEVGNGQTIPVVAQVPGPVTGLPEPESGTFFIVSRVVAEAVPERRDLLYPARLERDEKGRVVGCTALGVVHP